jgi:hypothetical protein
LGCTANSSPRGNGLARRYMLKVFSLNKQTNTEVSSRGGRVQESGKAWRGEGS